MHDPLNGAGEPAAEDIVLVEAGADPELLEAISPPEAGDGRSSRPRRSAQERIDEVTRARREAEREADYWRSIAEAAVSELEAALDGAEGQAAYDGPDPNDYVHGEDDAEFIRDLVQHQMRQDYERQAHDFAMVHEAQRANDIFTERQRQAAHRLPGYENIVVEGAMRGDWPCSPEMAQAIKGSETGPELAYYLATHPEEARRIAALSHASQIREIGRLEGRLQQEPPQARAAKTATSAPEPPPLVRGGGGRFIVSPDTADFAAFDKQYG